MSVQNGQYFEEASTNANVTSERLVPPSLPDMKTQKIVLDNENNRAQKYPL